MDEIEEKNSAAEELKKTIQQLEEEKARLQQDVEAKIAVNLFIIHDNFKSYRFQLEKRCKELEALTRDLKREHDNQLAEVKSSLVRIPSYFFCNYISRRF